jgi:ABC-2 type transport system permease protein
VSAGGTWPQDRRARSAGRDAGARRGSAVRMEVVRLGTVRSTYLLLGMAVGSGSLIGLLVALLTPAGNLGGEDTATVVTAGGDVMPLSVVGVLMGVLAALTVSHDYRYGLVRAVLTAVPSRGTLLAARLVVLSALAVATAVLVSAFGATLGAVAGRRPLLDGATLRVVAFHAVVAVGWVWLGAALGWLLRHAAGVVALMLVLPLFVEPVLLLVSRFQDAGGLRPIVTWLPFTAAREALGRQLLGADGAVGALPAAIAFTGTAGLAVALAWWRLRRSDS